MRARARRCSCTASPSRPARSRAGREGGDRARTRSPPRNASRRASCPARARRFASARHATSYGVFVDPQRVERPHEERRGNRLGGEPPRRRALTVFADERDAPRADELPDARRVGDAYDVERLFERVGLGRRQLLPEAHAHVPDQRRAAPWADDEQAVRLGEGDPVLPVRHRPKRPELIVERAPLDRRPRVDRHGVPPGLLEDSRKPGGQAAHVGSVEPVQNPRRSRGRI